MNWSHPSSLPGVLNAGVALSVSTPGVMKAVPQLDVTRILGRWHEIARLPSPLQRLTDHDIRLDLEQPEPGQFRLRRTSTGPDGSERVHDTLARRRFAVEEPGQFQRSTAPAWAQWLPSAWKDLWVLAIAADSQWLMLGEPRRRELWILSREPTMERQVLEALKSLARGQGYDLAPLVVSGRLQTFQVL
ncbi:MAG TPA: lipocalin family protein [Dyella sp.]|nr:lipocalin family protein [Dyella sp.]